MEDENGNFLQVCTEFAEVMSEMSAQRVNG